MVNNQLAIRSGPRTAAEPARRPALRVLDAGVEGGDGPDDEPRAVILADAGLLDLHGPSLVEALRRESPNLPVVVVADDQADWARAGLLRALDAHLGHQPAHRRARREARGRSLAMLRDRHEGLLRELRLAEQVQRSMLPRVMPSLPGVEFGAALRASLHLAGDFYNAFRLDGDQVGFYLGDVMGHGPAAALLGVFAMQAIRTKQIEGHNYEIFPPDQALAMLNRELIAADYPGGPFVTIAYGVLDVSARTWTYCCGGHPPALLLRPGEPPVMLGVGGPLLGVFEAPFAHQVVALSSGDRIVLYSDGIDSVRWGTHGDGVAGLTNLLSIRDGRSPQELIDSAMALANQDEQEGDDLTLLMAEFREPPPGD